MHARRSYTGRTRRPVAILMALGLTALAAQVVGTGTALAASGDINTVVGNGTAGYTGDGGQGTSAQLNAPQGIRVDISGNAYIADTGNNVIRKLSAAGIITTFAGNGTAGFSGDGGAATSARLSAPTAVALDGAGDVFIADNGNNRVRKVSPSGTITTVVGTGTAGETGDGGPALAAEIQGVTGVAVDGAGDIFVSDNLDFVVRKVDTSGTIRVYAGVIGQRSCCGNGGPATSAGLVDPLGLTVDLAGTLYIADGDDNVARKVGTNGIIHNVTDDYMGLPSDVAVDSVGNVYVTDQSFSVVHKIDPSGTDTIVAGNVFAGDDAGNGVPATQGDVANPPSVAVGPGGSLYITTALSDVREITGSPDLLALAMSADGNVAVGGGFSYQLTMTHDSSAGPATGVTVTDTLPAGATFVGATTSTGSCTRSGITLTCALGDMATPTQVTITIHMTAPSTSVGLTSTAAVTANQSDPNTADNSASATAFVTPADLNVNVSASPDPSNAGSPLAYTATVANVGPNPATGVKLSDPLPAGMSFVSATATQGSCSQAGGTVTCALGTVAVGGSATVTINVTPTVPGTPTNTVTVSSDQVDPTPGDATASVQSTVIPAGCGQAITKSTTLTADIGPCPGDGVVVGADNITLNLNGHKIFGTGNGKDFSTNYYNYAGVVLRQRTGVTVKGGTVSNFEGGVEIVAGGHNTVTNMTVRDNIGNDNPSRGQRGGIDTVSIGEGILVGDSALNTITSNTVVHNGPFDGIAVVGPDANSNLVQGNTVQNTISDSNHDDGLGIVVSAAFLPYESRFPPISHNNVIANTVTGNAASGISVSSNMSATMSDNTVTGNGLTSAPGNGIEIAALDGYNPNTQDLVKNNTVSGNGADGIVVRSNSNTMKSNTAYGNKALPGAGFDLHDTNVDAGGHPSCAANVWASNAWGAGAGYSPACVSSGGHQLQARRFS